MLTQLAKLYGVQSSYRNAGGGRVRVGSETMLAMLRALGAPVETAADLADAYRERRRALWTTPLEPVAVAWEGAGRLSLRLPADRLDSALGCAVDLEDGRRLTWKVDRDALLRAVTAETDLDGRAHVELSVPTPFLPPGYHMATASVGREPSTCVVVSGPRRTVDRKEREWGVFLPLYSLRTRRSWGVGDLTDLEALTDWVAGLGGSLSATLPLLAAFLDRPFEPSPYSPASRLFWNELYLDVERMLKRASAGGSAIPASVRAKVRRFRAEPLVDYQGIAETKRRMLEPLAEAFFSQRDQWPPGFGAFLRTCRDYAEFRANTERRGTTWRSWPSKEREGYLPHRGGHPAAFRYHVYVQWLMASQMSDLSGGTRTRGAGLYFDLPVGVHADGYDVWRHRDAFVIGASAGAPPDPFFSHGQDWGFPPMHPEGARQDGYRYLIGCLRHLFRHAEVVRIDHVMGLHRMYVVPPGMDARHGTYVRYRPEELYAILCLESSRTGTVVLGEDLGTVPRPVRDAMARHGVYRTYVAQFELRPNRARAVVPPPARSMATINTHDLPPFGAFWRGADIRQRLKEGWIGPDQALREERHRDRIRTAVGEYLRRKGWVRPGTGIPTERAALGGLLAHLAASDARLVVANLEDLWLERNPQNVPGTWGRFPNWRRKARYPFEEFRRMRAVTSTLELIDRLRKGR